MTSPPEDRSQLAVAYAWATRISTISALMVAPGLIGYWIDQKLGTSVLFTLLGFVLGMPTGLWLLLIAVRDSDDTKDSPPRDGSSDEE